MRFLIAILLLAFAMSGPLSLATASAEGLGGENDGGGLGGENDGGGLGGENDGGGLGNGNVGLQNPLNNIDSLPEFLDAILKAVVQIGTIILVLMLVYVGFLFVAAQGNEEKIRTARSALMWTVIGGFILLGAQAISLVIQGTVEGL